MKEYRDNWEQSVGNKNADWDKQDDTFRYINETQSPELNIGEYWYIKYPGAIALVEVKIEQVTSNTVLLKQTDLPYNSPMRYEISSIKFVEKVEKL